MFGVNGAAEWWGKGGWGCVLGNERDEIRNLDDGGVKAGSEIGMGDSETHQETDGQRDRRPHEK